MSILALHIVNTGIDVCYMLWHYFEPTTAQEGVISKMHISENLFIAKYLLNPIKDDSINSVAVNERKTRQALSAKINRVNDRFPFLIDMLNLSDLRITDVSDENLELFVSHCSYKDLYEKTAIEIVSKTATEFYARSKAFNAKRYPDGNARPPKRKF